MCGAEAAGISVVVTHVALLTFLHNLVPTDGLVTHWRPSITQPLNAHAHTDPTHRREPFWRLTLEAVVLLQLEDVADVLDAARGELVVVFSCAVRGLREHQIAAFPAIRAQVAAVGSLVVLQSQPREGFFFQPANKVQNVQQVDIKYVESTNEEMKDIFGLAGKMFIFLLRQWFYRKS